MYTHETLRGAPKEHDSFLTAAVFILVEKGGIVGGQTRSLEKRIASGLSLFALTLCLFRMPCTPTGWVGSNPIHCHVSRVSGRTSYGRNKAFCRCDGSRPEGWWTGLVVIAIPTDYQRLSPAPILGALSIYMSSISRPSDTLSQHCSECAYSVFPGKHRANAASSATGDSRAVGAGRSFFFSLLFFLSLCSRDTGVRHSTAYSDDLGPAPRPPLLGVSTEVLYHRRKKPLPSANKPAYSQD
ncbi:hypothetical protein F4802DRAFT_60094 [Xylaria palmicola]|nr:hypothetical protein F4802DRAFT_60094 [Xylaria palmicola]